MYNKYINDFFLKKISILKKMLLDSKNLKFIQIILDCIEKYSLCVKLFQTIKIDGKNLDLLNKINELVVVAYESKNLSTVLYTINLIHQILTNYEMINSFPVFTNTNKVTKSFYKKINWNRFRLGINYQNDFYTIEFDRKKNHQLQGYLHCKSFKQIEGLLLNMKSKEKRKFLRFFFGFQTVAGFVVIRNNYELLQVENFNNFMTTFNTNQKITEKTIPKVVSDVQTHFEKDIESEENDSDTELQFDREDNIVTYHRKQYREKNNSEDSWMSDPVEYDENIYQSRAPRQEIVTGSELEQIGIISMSRSLDPQRSEHFVNEYDNVLNSDQGTDLLRTMMDYGESRFRDDPSTSHEHLREIRTLSRNLDKYDDNGDLI